MAEARRYTPEMVAEYLRLGHWNNETLSQKWDENAVLHPEGEAVADSVTRESWASSKSLIDRIALALIRQGLKRGELVVLQLPNSVELCLTRVACEKAGLLCLPVLRTLRDAEMEYILRFTRASALVVRDEYRGFDYTRMVQDIRPRLHELRKVFVSGARVPKWAIPYRDIVNDIAEGSISQDHLRAARYRASEISLICSTTGTTGFPKFVQYSSAARMVFSRGVIDALGLTANDTLAALSPAPSGPNVAVYFGAPQIAARVVFLERFEPEEALKLLVRERVTVACGVPAQMALILQHPRLADYDLGSVRAWWSTGAELPYSLAKEFEDKTGVKVVNDYGAVDFGGIVSAGIEDPEGTRLLSVGKPRAGTMIKLMDDAGQEVPAGEIGEVWGSGPSCSGGYYLDPEATSKAWTEGWFATGDLGKFDREGNLVIVGRKKDMVIRGGWNIYPKEIEGILLSHPAIQDAAVVGMPDPIMGERLCAYVVMRSREVLSLDDVAAFLRAKGLPPYKVPDRLEILGKIPMVADGQKADKKALRQDIAQKLKAEGKA